MAKINCNDIITSLNTGGAELQLLALCAHLPRERALCRVLSLVADGNLVPRFADEDIEVFALDRRDTGGPAGQMLALVREIEARIGR